MKRSQPRGGSARVAVLSFVVVVGIAVAAVVGVAGCSSDGGTCTPGKQSACGCPDGQKSAQVCLDDGSGFGPCLGCPASTGSGVGSSSCKSYCNMCLGQVDCTQECRDNPGCDGAWATVAACAQAEGCGSPTCTGASDALAQCLGSTGTSTSGPSTGSGGDQTLSCLVNQGGTEICAEERNVSSSDASNFVSLCNTQLHGNIVGQCPTQSLEGCCSMDSSSFTTVICYYSGSESSNQSSCISDGGTWGHSP